MRDHRHAMALAAVLGLLAMACERDAGLVDPGAIAASLVAEVEPNDACAAPQDLGPVTLPLVQNGSLDGFPFPSGDVDFYRFAGPPNVAVRIDLEGQSTGQGTLGDPFLGLFDSGCNLLGANDDNGMNLNSRLVATIPADGIAVLAVTRCCDGGFDQGGSGSYLLTVQEILPPSNDDFSAAIVIPAVPFSAGVDLAAATTELAEPSPSCTVPFGGIGRTAWYSYTPATTGSVTGSLVNAGFSPAVAVYSGGGLGDLGEIRCAVFGGGATVRAEAGTTYYFQVGGLFGSGGLAEFRLETTPPPVAGFGFSPFDPSVFDVVQFFDFSFDPGGVGFESQAWRFGDGATGTGCCPTHPYAADGDYTVELTVTTFDGRSATASQVVGVRTHDVAITRFTVPKAASAGQTRSIVAGVNSRRYPEQVEVQLYKSVPGGYQFVGVLSQSVPVRPANRITNFAFSYTFSADDARIGKVTFRTVAVILGARDALPADNEAIAAPTKVNR